MSARPDCTHFLSTSFHVIQLDRLYCAFCPIDKKGDPEWRLGEQAMVNHLNHSHHGRDGEYGWLPNIHYFTGEELICLIRKMQLKMTEQVDAFVEMLNRAEYSSDDFIQDVGGKR